MPKPTAGTTARRTLAAPQPFELPLALHGHGWYALAPNEIDSDGTWRFALQLDDEVVDVEVRAGHGGPGIALRGAAALSRDQQQRAFAAVRHMLRLDDDLAPFWRLTGEMPHMRWIARRGGGRLLRSPTVFEDLMKLLFTTNCTWTQTEAMTRNLVAALGSPSPSGRRAFPSAAACVRDETFWRQQVKVGYRARACRELAEGFAGGALAEHDFLRPQPTAELRARLLALRGIGPYAAGQAMRLLGHYDELALDSWCRARVRELRGRATSDAAITRRYAPFAPFQGLAMWCDLTAEWHGERPRAGQRQAWW